MPANLPASVRQRLLNIAVKQGRDPNLVFLQYACERFLYRLSITDTQRHFVLKGAMVFIAWTAMPLRVTKDIDLLGAGNNSTESVSKLFQHVCEKEVEPDGLRFDVESIIVDDIREDQKYIGRRVTLLAYLGNARIHLQIDIGFGDAVTPEPLEIEFPTLLDFPAPRIRAYAKETVIAEKLNAMVELGIRNSRMKDYFDIWMLSRLFPFKGTVLIAAIKATFEQRVTQFPQSVPVGLMDEFAQNAEKAVQWGGFLRRSHLMEAPESFGRLVVDLRGFLLPLLDALRQGVEFSSSWRPGECWKKE